MLPNLSSITKGQVKRRAQNNFVMPVVVLVCLFLIGQAFWLNKNKHMFRPFSITKINCEECQKTGVIRDSDDDRIKVMCPSCYGVGYHSVRRFDEFDAVCPACGGMGRTDVDGAWRLCERCDGRGIYRLNEWKEIIGIDIMDFETQTIIKETIETLGTQQPEPGTQ